VPGFSAQDFLIAVAEGKQTIEAIPSVQDPKPRRRVTRKERKLS
jgi:hypothetical protein